MSNYNQNGLTGQPEYVHNANQGIVDGRPEGRQPTPAKVTMDTLTNTDASGGSAAATGVDKLASSTMVGATSADVHNGFGHPGMGMSSKEEHHDGQSGRKKQHQGTAQWGPPKERAKEMVSDSQYTDRK